MAHRYNRVSPKFWPDTKREGWDEKEKHLGLYVMTCPHRTTEGLFHLPQPYICSDLEWDTGTLSEPFGKLLSRGFIHYDDDAEVILLTNALRYQAPENPNQIKAAVAHIEELPPTPLLSLLTTLAEGFCQPFAKALRDTFGTLAGTDSKPIGEPQALALAPAQALTPPPAGGGEEICETVAKQLLEEGFTHSDIEFPLTALHGELKTDPDRIESPIGWTRARATKARDQRLAAEKASEPKEIPLADGTVHVIPGRSA